jgi:hypothetical protein
MELQTLTLGFITDQRIDHPGLVQFYMAKTQDDKSIDSWDGSGQVWFNVAFLGDTITPKGIEWPTYSK